MKRKQINMWSRWHDVHRAGKNNKKYLLSLFFWSTCNFIERININSFSQFVCRQILHLFCRFDVTQSSLNHYYLLVILCTGKLLPTVFWNIFVINTCLITFYWKKLIESEDGEKNIIWSWWRGVRKENIMDIKFTVIWMKHNVNDCAIFIFRSICFNLHEW